VPGGGFRGTKPVAKGKETMIRVGKKVLYIIEELAAGRGKKRKVNDSIQMGRKSLGKRGSD